MSRLSKPKIGAALKCNCNPVWHLWHDLLQRVTSRRPRNGVLPRPFKANEQKLTTTITFESGAPTDHLGGIEYQWQT